MKKKITSIDHNLLKSNIDSLLDELSCGIMTRESLLSGISSCLIDANVESTLVVDVLSEFGKDGEEVALGIKVREGW